MMHRGPVSRERFCLNKFLAFTDRPATGALSQRGPDFAVIICAKIPRSGRDHGARSQGCIVAWATAARAKDGGGCGQPRATGRRASRRRGAASSALAPGRFFNLGMCLLAQIPGFGLKWFADLGFVTLRSAAGLARCAVWAKPPIQGRNLWRKFCRLGAAPT